MDSTPSCLLESDGSPVLEPKKMSDNTLMALIKFLLKTIPNIVGKAAAMSAEEVVLDSLSVFLPNTGTVWTASAHIINNCGYQLWVLSLAWATAQLGWIAGPTVLFLFSFVTYYTSCLLAACYGSGDSVIWKPNYTYMEAVQNNLG